MSDKPASPARGRKKTAPPAQQPPQEEVVVRLPLTDLYPFPDHPFQVRDDEEMKETIQSVKEYGVIVPAIVRPREEGGYRRIWMYCAEEKSVTEIAKLEGVTKASISLSLDGAMKKISKKFVKALKNT